MNFLFASAFPLLFAAALLVFAEAPHKYEDLPFFDAFSKISQVLPRPPQFGSHVDIKERIASSRRQMAEELKRSSKLRPGRGRKMDICPYSIGGYYVINSESFIDAETGQAECARFGLQYAIVTDERIDEAVWTLTNCTGLSVGIRSYDGFLNDGCQLMQGSSVFLFTLDPTECTHLLSLPLLCQEVPIQVTTDTTYDSSLTTTITSIATVTTPATTPGEEIFSMDSKVVHSGHHSGRIDRELLARSRKMIRGTVIDGFDVCPASVNGLHIIYDSFFYNDAALACSSFGWARADIDAANIPDVLALFDMCQPIDVLFSINSFAGMASGTCRLAYVLPWYNVWGMTGANSFVCYYLAAPVICQEAPATATASSGTAVLSTSVQTTTLTIPGFTDTVTETVSA